jgi:hypothetical protein
MPVDPVVKPDPGPPQPPPRPPITLETEGDVAHVCGLVPGTIVNITVRHPLTRDIYMQVTRTASEEGCVEAPLILTPPVVVPDDPIICPEPPRITKPAPVIVVDTDPTGPTGPIVDTPLDPPYDPPYGGGGGGAGFIDYGLVPNERSDLFSFLENRGVIGRGTATNFEQSLGIDGY